MKIAGIINKSKIVAPLIATGLTIGCQNMYNIPTQNKNDEIVLSKDNSNKNSHYKNNKKITTKDNSNGLWGDVCLGMLAIFSGVSLLAAHKAKDEGN